MLPGLKLRRMSESGEPPASQRKSFDSNAFSSNLANNHSYRGFNSLFIYFQHVGWVIAYIKYKLLQRSRKWSTVSFLNVCAIYAAWCYFAETYFVLIKMNITNCNTWPLALSSSALGWSAYGALKFLFQSLLIRSAWFRFKILPFFLNIRIYVKHEKKSQIEIFNPQHVA